MAQTTFRYLSHCCIDIQKTRRFYEDLLGFELDNARDSNDQATAKVLRMSWPFAVNLVFLKRDDFMIELQDFPLHGTVAGAPDFGGQVVEETNVGRTAMVRDPDGQVIELVAAP